MYSTAGSLSGSSTRSSVDRGSPCLWKQQGLHFSIFLWPLYFKEPFVIIALHVGLYLGSKIDALAFAQQQSFKSKDPKERTQKENSQRWIDCVLPGDHWHHNGDSKRSRRLVWKLDHKQWTLIERELHLTSASAYLLVSVTRAFGSTLAAPSREAPPGFQLAEQKQGEQLPVSDLHPFPADMMSIFRKIRGTLFTRFESIT